MPTRKLHAKLSDGRDVFYFDDSGSELGATRKIDSRESEPRPELAEMRLDVLSGEWISVATHRHGRAFLPSADKCPLCPSHSGFASELPDVFDVAVFENRNPSFAQVAGTVDDKNYWVEPTLPLGVTKPSIGRCEVVVFSPHHEGSLASQTPTRIRTILDALADRTDAILRMPGVRTVFPFENRGQEIGVTLQHPHGQIYAYPYVTPTQEKIYASLARHGNDLFQDILEFEQGSERELIRGEHFTAFVPFAARWPIETTIMPHRHVQNLTELTEDELAELTSVYSRVLRGVDAMYDSPTPYVAGWHQAPQFDGGENFRLHFKLTSPRRAADKLKYLAGSESAMGAFIADFPQETTAARLREVIR
jgi:UDPglucose--hexose-1-phosphate uridylyltransferase